MGAALVYWDDADAYCDLVNEIVEQAQACRDVSRLMRELSDMPESDVAVRLALLRSLTDGDMDLAGSILSATSIVSEDDSEPHGILYSAIESFGDRADVVELLVSHGARIDIRGANGWTCLHFASRRGYVHVARLLIELGVAVDAVTACDGGVTPLMEAASAGHAHVVEALLAAGADPDLRESLCGENAAEMAKRAGHREVVSLFAARSEADARAARKRRP